MDGRGREEDKAAKDGERRGWNGGEWRGGDGREARRENRARLGFAMTNGRRGHSAPPFVSIQERLLHVGLSLRGECLSLARVTSSVLAEDPSSSSFFRLGPPGHAVFSFCPWDLSPLPHPPSFVSFCLSSIVCLSLRLECDIFVSYVFSLIYHHFMLARIYFIVRYIYRYFNNFNCSCNRINMR